MKWKGRKKSVFVDYIVVYVENPKESMNKTPETNER